MRAVALLLLCFALPVAYSQDGATTGQSPMSVPTAAPADVSSAAPDPAAGLPTATTEIAFRMTKANKEKKPTVGDIVVLTLKTGPENGVGAQLADFAKLEAAPVEWGEGRILWWKPYDAKTDAITIGVTTYKPGKLLIKSIPFVKDGKAAFASEPKEVEFGSVGGDKMKDDIYPPVPVSLPLWLLAILVLLSAGLAAAILWWIHRWHSRRKSLIEELAKAPKILTPIEEFEKVRRESDQKGWIEKGSHKPYYFALSEAAKRFLGKSYRFDAEERTTRELLVELEKLGMSVALIDQWERICDEMDLIKFTDQVPPAEVARSVGSRLSQIVALSYAKSPFMVELLAEQQKALQQAGAKKQSGATR